MKIRLRGTVDRIEVDGPDAQEILVRLDDHLRRAVNYPALSGRVSTGDTVTLNTCAVEMELGTGGVDFVVECEGGMLEAEPPGHIMKLRYTPLQHPVLAAEAPESPHHGAVAEFRSLEETPVVCAELHSQVPAIAAAAKWESRGAARVVYVMTDGAALPIAFSRLVRSMREQRLIDATVTAGQAFGGDYEAVNVYSALAVASAAANADVVIVCQGPGNAGTATPLGFSGLDQGVALNAAASLGGTPIAVARLSFADPRPRHVGISHHTCTVLERIAMCQALVPLPRLPESERRYLRAFLEAHRLFEKHEFITVDAEGGLDALIRSGIPVTTMGRSIDEERCFFLAAAAAGLLAGQWFSGTREKSHPIRFERG